MGEWQEKAMAARVDNRLGIRERAEFFGPRESPLFGFLHAPIGRPVGGVVICPSICADFMANYRREVLIAREMAERKIAVQRFHYRGTGNSHGRLADVTFQSLEDDTLLAVEHLMAQVDLDAIAFLGTRWGGLVAASAISNYPSAALALWEPTIRAAQFFREGLRARMAHDLKSGRESRGSLQQLLAELEAEGRVDLLGYPVHSALYETSKDRNMTTLLGTDPRSVLLVQLAQLAGLRSEYRQFVSDLRDNGFQLDTAAVATAETWWFPHERVETPDDLLRSTVDWLAAHFDGAYRSG